MAAASYVVPMPAASHDFCCGGRADTSVPAAATACGRKCAWVRGRAERKGRGQPRKPVAGVAQRPRRTKRKWCVCILSKRATPRVPREALATTAGATPCTQQGNPRRQCPALRVHSCTVGSTSSACRHLPLEVFVSRAFVIAGGKAPVQIVTESERTCSAGPIKGHAGSTNAVNKVDGTHNRRKHGRKARRRRNER